MKRFIYTILFFMSPFIILIGITKLCYIETGGDLNRLGKISIDKNYRDKFQKDYNQAQNYTEFSTINLDDLNTFDILTVGDSFSQQRSHSYQNYLTNYSISVLNFDTRAYAIPSFNPIDFAYKLANGDILNKLNIKYLILQSVERSITTRGEDLDQNTTITIKQLESFRKTQNDNHHLSYTENYSDYLKFPIYNFLYNFSDNALFSPIHQKNINKKIFSTDNKLLFLEDDLIALEKNNNLKLVKQLNNELNTLAKKLRKQSITLIVLPSPDKYDIHYDYITTKDNPEPLFFNLIRDLKKEYIYIDSKIVLKKHIDNEIQDVYFVDDSHWSPIGAKIIANSITEAIHNNATSFTQKASDRQNLMAK
ncbi:MAG: hypothetical protein HRT69_12145 [Flavobacteriaceae bacterium]|nr:hypothetical protein [Flavobacteriaceae bacterium]